MSPSPALVNVILQQYDTDIGYVFYPKFSTLTCRHENVRTGTKQDWTRISSIVFTHNAAFPLRQCACIITEMMYATLQSVARSILAHDTHHNPLKRAMHVPSNFFLCSEIPLSPDRQHQEKSRSASCFLPSRLRKGNLPRGPYGSLCVSLVYDLDSESQLALARHNPRQ